MAAFSRLPRVAVLAGAATLLANTPLGACSWDRPIWEKKPKSRTSLLRFFVDGRAGFIDAKGKVVIPATFPVSGNTGTDDFLGDVAATSQVRITPPRA